MYYSFAALLQSCILPPLPPISSLFAQPLSCRLALALDHTRDRGGLTDHAAAAPFSLSLLGIRAKMSAGDSDTVVLRWGGDSGGAQPPFSSEQEAWHENAGAGRSFRGSHNGTKGPVCEAVLGAGSLRGLSHPKSSSQSCLTSEKPI